MADDLVKFLRDQSLYKPGQEGQEREWCRQMNAAADRIEILERELEQAAVRFETMHKNLVYLTSAALIGGENCRTPLSTPDK